MSGEIRVIEGAPAVIAQLDRMRAELTARLPAGTFPLTCTFCRRSSATHVLVWDTPDAKRGNARTIALVCGGCAHRDEERARQIAVSPASAWLFRLAPDNEETCDA